jgi:hypothetical protein
MTGFQIYALYIAPIVVLGIGVLVYFLTNERAGHSR